MYEKTDAEILAESREYLESHGWWRGSTVGPNGRQVCGMGAVIYSQDWARVAGDVRVDHRPDLDRILAKVMLVIRPEYTPLPFASAVDQFMLWNDNDAENKQEVLDVFMKAEKIERNGNA